MESTLSGLFQAQTQSLNFALIYITDEVGKNIKKWERNLLAFGERENPAPSVLERRGKNKKKIPTISSQDFMVFGRLAAPGEGPSQSDI